MFRGCYRIKTEEVKLHRKPLLFTFSGTFTNCLSAQSKLVSKIKSLNMNLKYQEGSEFKAVNSVILGVLFFHKGKQSSV